MGYILSQGRARDAEPFGVEVRLDSFVISGALEADGTGTIWPYPHAFSYGAGSVEFRLDHLNQLRAVLDAVEGYIRADRREPDEWPTP